MKPSSMPTSDIEPARAPVAAPTAIRCWWFIHNDRSPNITHADPERVAGVVLASPAGACTYPPRPSGVARRQLISVAARGCVWVSASTRRAGAGWRVQGEGVAIDRPAER